MKLLTPPKKPAPPIKLLSIKFEYSEEDIEASDSGSFPELTVSVTACQVLDEDLTPDQIRELALDTFFKLFARLQNKLKGAA